MTNSPKQQENNSRQSQQKDKNINPHKKAKTDLASAGTTFYVENDPKKYSWLQLETKPRKLLREEKINNFFAKQYRRYNANHVNNITGRWPEDSGHTGLADGVFKLDHKFWNVNIESFSLKRK